MDRVVGCVEVVAAAAQLGVAPPKVAALTVRRLRAVQPTAAGRGPVYCRRERRWGERQGGWGGEAVEGREGRRERKGCGLLRSRRTFRLWQHGALTSPRRAQEMPCCSIYVYQIQTSGLHLAQAPSLPTTSTSEELSGPLPFLVQG